MDIDWEMKEEYVANDMEDDNEDSGDCENDICKTDSCFIMFC